MKDLLRIILNDPGLFLNDAVCGIVMIALSICIFFAGVCLA